MRFLLLLALLIQADQPKLVTRVFPPMQTLNVAAGCSTVIMTAEIKGVEDERWYCPRIVWEMPDGTEAMEESDCAPFADRDDYPRVWRRRVCAPEGEWTVVVKLIKNSDTVARAEIRFFIR